MGWADGCTRTATAASVASLQIPSVNRWNAGESDDLRDYLLQGLAGIELQVRGGPQQRFNCFLEFQAPRQLLRMFAVGIGRPVNEPLGHHLGRDAEQHNSIEAGPEHPEVRRAPTDEERAVPVLRQQFPDPILPPHPVLPWL